MKLYTKDMLWNVLGAELISPEDMGDWFSWSRNKWDYLEHYALKRLEEKRTLREDEYEESRYYVKNCGKKGKVEFYKDGSIKYVPSFCGDRGLCVHCHLRYKNRQRFQEENRIMAIVKALGVEEVMFPVFTLHEVISSYVMAESGKERAGLLSELSGLAVKTIKQLQGVDARWGNGASGIISSVHVLGGKNPFKAHVHFHLMCLPVHVSKKSDIEVLPFYLDKDVAKKLWAENQMDFCVKHGIPADIKNTNLKLAYVSTSKIKQLRFRLRYIFRALAEDVFDSVRGLKKDYSKFLWVETHGDNVVPHVDDIELLEDTLQVVMKPGGRMIKPYGYFVNYKKYAPVFGLREVEYGPDEKPIKTLSCEFNREYERDWSMGFKRPPLKVKVWAKYEGKDWHFVALAKVVGELCSGPRVKRWVPKGEDDKWNYWDPP